MSLCGEKSAQTDSCARGALPGTAAISEPHGCVVRGTWQKVFASSAMKGRQGGLLSFLPLVFCKEVKSLLECNSTPLNWDGRNYMVVMNP